MSVLLINLTGVVIRTCPLHPFGPVIIKDQKVSKYFTRYFTLIEISLYRRIFISFLTFFYHSLFFSFIDYCGNNEHQCGDGTCIPAFNKCDFFPDCDDESDEISCGKLYTFFFSFKILFLSRYIFVYTIDISILNVALHMPFVCDVTSI
jgi:hypothetical protein